jgi:DNA-binding XRE family transcriptional regulator
VTHVIPDTSRKRDGALQFGRELVRAMKKRGIGTRTLADPLGASRTSVMYWRTGRILPRLETAQRLAQALDWPRLVSLAVEFRRKRCLVDDVEFVDDSGSDNRLYCSDSCQRVAEKRRRGSTIDKRAGNAERRLTVHQRAVAAFCAGCELVAVPVTEQVQTGLFGDLYDVADHLEQCVARGIADGWLASRDVEIHRKDGRVETGRRMGERYKALVYDGIPVDLFIVRPPADFGVVLAIRTGPAEFSHRLVTDCQQFFMRVQDGRLIRGGRHVPCDDEPAFFAAIGQPWLEPRDRRPERVQLQRALVR